MSPLVRFVIQDYLVYQKSISLLKFMYRYHFDLSFNTLIRYRFMQYLYMKLGGGIFYRLLKCFYMRRNAKYGCCLYPETRIGEGVVFPHNFPIVIHNNAIIGKKCVIHPNVQIGSTRTKEGEPVIGNCCFLGNGCHIVGKIIIGDYCFISPGAFVCKDIPSGSVVGYGVNNILSSDGKRIVSLYLLR